MPSRAAPATQEVLVVGHIQPHSARVAPVGAPLATYVPTLLEVNKPPWLRTSADGGVVIVCFGAPPLLPNLDTKGFQVAPLNIVVVLSAEVFLFESPRIPPRSGLMVVQEQILYEVVLVMILISLVPQLIPLLKLLMRE